MTHDKLIYLRSEFSREAKKIEMDIPDEMIEETKNIN